jgi:hypothetical protein
MHLSCTDTNTISKWTKTRFHMTHVTFEFHRVRLRRLLRLWYVRHKPCTYLASRLAISLNGLDRASTWALSPRSTIRCVQNDFWACGTFRTNRAPILHQDLQYLQTNWIKHPLEPHHLGVPSGASKMIFVPMVRSAQTLHISCIKISTISNELNQASTWASSPRSITWCVQNNFWTYGMFSTNHAPILNRQRHYLQMDQNMIPHDPRHLGDRSGASKIIFEVVVRSAQTIHLSCDMFGPNYAPILHRHSDYLQMDRNEIPQDPCHLVVPSGASKMISKPAVRSAQTVHLSCVKISTIFKRTKSSIHLRLVT